MLKKLVLISTLCLGGCASSAVTVQSIESAIQSWTADACGFVPTLETIDAVAAAVLGVVPGVDAVLALVGVSLQAVETDICAAVPPASSARRALLPRMGSPYAGHAGTLHFSGNAKGVPINGWIVH